jgi:succinoglycan biosynthesis transport protein ExoP
MGLSIDRIFGVLWRRRWTFALTFALCLATVVAVTFSLPRVYETRSYLLVASSRQASSDYEATQTNQVLSKTYAELLQTRNVANTVAAQLPFSISGAELQESVRVKPISQSQLIAITASASSALRAKVIADSYARVFVERVSELTAERAVTARVTLAETAPLVSDPARPRHVLNIAVGTLLALMLGGLVALLREHRDQRIELEGDTSELFGVPIIGRVPAGSTSLRRAFPGAEKYDAALSESFRLVLANLAFVNLGTRPSSVAVVSAGESEGKSTCSINVARAAAELGVSVALIDGDMRRPGLSRTTEENRWRPGFSTLLLKDSGSTLSEVAIDTPHPSLTFVPSGPIAPNPTALLGSGRLREVESIAKTLFELVIFDTPPLLVGADGYLIAAATEGVILVVDASRTPRDAALQAVTQLRRAQVNLLGVVINRVPHARNQFYLYGGKHAVQAESQTNGGRSLRGLRRAKSQ